MSVHKEIQALLNASEKKQYQIAKESGIRASTLTYVYKSDKWGTQIDIAQKVLGTIGKELVIVDKV